MKAIIYAKIPFMQFLKPGGMSNMERRTANNQLSFGAQCSPLRQAEVVLWIISRSRKEAAAL